MNTKDIEILRRLGGRYAAICASPANAAKRKLITDLNSLRAERPVLFATPDAAWGEILPVASLECEDPLARGWERKIRAYIYSAEVIQDDSAFEPCINIPWRVQQDDFGFTVNYQYGENRGSCHWDAPIKDLEQGLKDIKPRQYSVDKARAYAELETAKQVFAGILDARIRDANFWSMGLTRECIRLIGLQELMLYMYDQPDNLKALMAFMRDDHLRYLQWQEDNGLLCLNNEDDYIGSGGFGYTHELPGADYRPGMPVRPRQMWVLSESQETVGVSPEMFEEFILEYQATITDKFGLVYYGCCEGLHQRIDPIIKRMKNLRYVSVSPWCDQKIIADKLGENYVFSRKPNPATICVSFDEEAIRKDIRETLEVTRGLQVQFMMKDTHTVQNDMKRIPRWVQIAREEINAFS